MTQTAIDALSGMFGSVVEDDKQWAHKSEIICNFAVGVSEAVLKRAGFDEPYSEAWQANMLVEAMHNQGNMDFPPQDFIDDIYLNKVPTSLSQTNPDKLVTEHHLIFGNGRVLEWNGKTHKPNRVMTYEEAARFVVFWLAEKILLIIRKNEWDRIKQLPDLFDRLTRFATSLSQPQLSSGAKLQRELELPYNPDLLLAAVEDFNFSVQCYNTIKNLRINRIDQLLFMTEDELLRHRDISRNLVKRLQKELGEKGLQLNIKLPPEVQAWYEARL